MKILHLLCLMPLMAFAKPAPTKLSLKDVDNTLASYRKAKAIRAKINKTVVQETMGSENKSQGEFYFSKGKLRLEFLEPEHTLLVYDGKYFWFESRLDEEHIEVTKMRGVDLRKSDSILASLFDAKDALKSFNLVKQSQVGGRKIFVYEAKDKKKSDVQKLTLALKGKDIDQIEYTDRIENKVTLDFSDLKKGSVPADKFAYKPPKGASVTEP